MIRERHTDNTRDEQPAGLDPRSLDIQYLDADKLRFWQHGDGLRLTIDGKASYPSVTPMRAFPLSDPDRYVSIRVCSRDLEEIGLIRNLADLPHDQAEILRQQLLRRYVHVKVLRVLSLNERFGVQEWVFETDRGTRQVMTRRLRDSVNHPSPGRYLFKDVDGNRYDVEDLYGLDPASQSMLVQHL